MQPQNLVLIGYRGSGKTTVGRMLARALECHFIDTDELIEQQQGRTITDVFTTDGEKHFRELEAQVIADLDCRNKTVISAGGGSVEITAVRRRLRAMGFVIWLRASPQELHQRISSDPHSAGRRPALTAQAGVDEVRQKLEQRTPLYDDVADWTVETTGRSPVEIVQHIRAHFDAA